MRVQRIGNNVKLWLTANDTHKWANRPGATWPCSVLSGRPLYAEFEDGDLVDLHFDPHKENGVEVDCVPSDEFNAITSDFLKNLPNRPKQTPHVHP